MIDRPIPPDMKRCKGACGLVLELEAFYANPNYTDGRASKCKKCVNAEQKKRVQAHRVLRELQASAPPAVGNPSPLPVQGSHPLHDPKNDTPAAPPTKPSEVAQRLELATAILDEIANGRDDGLGEAIGKARQFIIVERGTGRYNRKPKP